MFTTRVGSLESPLRRRNHGCVEDGEWLGLGQIRTILVIKFDLQIPLSECFEKFNMPDLPRLEDRVKNNFIYFRTNYLALYVLLLVIAG